MYKLLIIIWAFAGDNIGLFITETDTGGITIVGIFIGGMTTGATIGGIVNGGMLIVGTTIGGTVNVTVSPIGLTVFIVFFIFFLN